ncbi:lamin tail domain-containing protein [Bradymonadales bacterium TMQ1]|uniref:Lamin tail domain-containing protein n=1 Tax=Lujinxingia sediminis TaxID=2480984 RepID=A0ABY0CSM8_9DELT|nr:lamin tail domain-containing protein [Lujinxingia sediminis]RVU43675.1 lamin tail domain-containing protein [Lujinxingia sediminis]TXC75796.1 lamin tail domain-containing protein [Bradymonadales bacterium TMQ1]
MRARWLTAGLLVAAAAGCVDTSDPGASSEQVLYRWETDGEPTTGERGNMLVNEINWAGSVSDDKSYDPDDVFIELLNKNPRPVNVSGWNLEIGGDYSRSFRLPKMEEPIQPNEFFVIAAKADGAFGAEADVILEGLKLGKRAVYVNLRDADRRLMDSGGSREEYIFAGSYDLVTTRSMERTQVLFGNRGNQDRAWTSNIDDVMGTGGERKIAEGWRTYTMASPGQANSADYTGSNTSGGFE